MKDNDLKEKIRQYSTQIMNLLKKHHKILKSNVNEITYGTINNSMSKESLIIKFDFLHLPYLYMRNKKRDNIFFNITQEENGNLVFKEKNNLIYMKTDNQINFDLNGIKFSFNNSYDFSYPLLKNKKEIFDMLLELKVKIEKTINLTKALDTLNSTSSKEQLIKAINVLKNDDIPQNIFGIIACVKQENIPIIMEELIKDTNEVIDIPNLLEKISYGWGSTISYYTLYKDVKFTLEQGFEHYRNMLPEIEGLILPIVEYHNLSRTLKENEPLLTVKNNFKI